LNQKLFCKKTKRNEIVENVLFVAKRFGGFDEEMLRKKWQLLNSNFTLEQREKINHLNFDDAWKTIVAIKDTDRKLKYLTISKLVNAIRSLPNSNTDAERVLSTLTDVKTETQQT